MFINMTPLPDMDSVYFLAMDSVGSPSPVTCYLSSFGVPPPTPLVMTPRIYSPPPFKQKNTNLVKLLRQLGDLTFRQ